MSEKPPTISERLAVLESKFQKLAEETGIVKVRQDEFRQWIHEHEKRELTLHNELMSAVNGIEVGVELIKADNQKRENEINSKSAKRKDTFDRILRVALAVVVLAGALSAAFEWIDKNYQKDRIIPLQESIKGAKQ